LFLSEILNASRNMFVHSPTTQLLIREKYSRECSLLPFSSYRGVNVDQLSTSSREAARTRIGLLPGQILLASFGFVAREKGPEVAIWALRQLRSWGYNALLAFVGDVGSAEIENEITGLADRIDVRNSVRLFKRPLNEDQYKDYLLAADFGLQLRTYALGGLSGGLLDCISTGLTSVANFHLAEAMEAPRFVIRVPDELSPFLIAESIANVIDRGAPKTRDLKAMKEYESEHNFDVYAHRLIQTLDLL